MIRSAVAAIAERRAEVFNPVHPRDPALAALFGAGRESATGIQVTDEKAMTYSAVFACVRVLAETAGSVPLHVFERLDPTGKRKAPEHPLYELLHHRPNPEMTSTEWREAMVANACLRGNAIVNVVRGPDGRPTELWPIPTKRVELRRVEGKLVWVVRPMGNEPARYLLQDEVLHVRLFSLDGLWGLSPIDCAREGIALGLAEEEYRARFYGNNAKPAGTLEHPGKISEAAIKRIQQDWSNLHQGLTNAHRVAFLEEGMKWHEMSVTPEAAEFIAGRSFQVRDVARWFRMPLHMIGDLERATFSNIEHQSIEFVKYTMMPWFVRFEQAFLRDLFVGPDRDRYFAEFSVQGLERGDMAARGEFYTKLHGVGAMNTDEVRDLENLNPLPNELGQKFYQPLNFAPIGEPSPAEKQAKAQRARLALGPLLVDAIRRVQAAEQRARRKNEEPDPELAARHVAPVLAAFESMAEVRCAPPAFGPDDDPHAVAAACLGG